MSAEQDNVLANFSKRFKLQHYELTKMGDGTSVVLSIDSGKVITLNEVATSIVDFITSEHDTGCVSTNLLLDHLLREYEVEADVLALHIRNFITELDASF